MLFRYEAEQNDRKIRLSVNTFLNGICQSVIVTVMDNKGVSDILLSSAEAILLKNFLENANILEYPKKESVL